MKHFKSKTLFLVFCAAALSFLPLSSKISVTALPLSDAQAYSSDSGISPLSDNIGWRYKVINGKMYKRQFNYSTNQWIGNWILVS